jgi:nucleotide-binding universal stress UspA family protein
MAFGMHSNLGDPRSLFNNQASSKMYNSVYVPVDNSDHSNTAVELGVKLGKVFGVDRLVGSHVYAAKLHDIRFKQMEFTLPDEYKEEQELEKQRKIHDSLIARGLQLISDCYLDDMDQQAQKAGVNFERLNADGRNFEAITEEINRGQYDLVVMGALGQGAVRDSKVGSVCERVLRRTTTDSLIIRQIDSGDLNGSESVLVAIDGSSRSYGALQSACAIAEKTGRNLEIVAIAEEGDELASLLKAHLKMAGNFASKQGLTVETTWLTGKVEETLIKHLNDTKPWCVAVGRTGLDANGLGSEGETSELGKLPQTLIRHSPSNVLIAASHYVPTGETENMELLAK